MNPIIMFYLGSHPDSHGRLLSEILEQDDFWLESCHNYIQWLFPNREFSRVTPDAPVLTKEIEREFQTDDLLQRHLMASFIRILSFYGLQRSDNEIMKASNWNERKSNWFIYDTHNNLRITRILKCLMLLGLKSEAQKFYNALIRLRETESDCGIENRAYNFWCEAIGS